MVLKLYGSPGSTCTKRVITVLKETNTPYELIRVDFAVAEHKSPAYLEKQPFGQIPYLEDEDGTIVFESRAIGRYVAAKARSPLLPTGDLKKVIAFETAASVEVSNFDPFASGIAYQRVFMPLFGKSPDETVVQDFVTKLESKLEGYERILGKQRYLAGDELTLADLYHLSYGAMLKPQGLGLLEDEGKFPNVARWWKEVSGRQSWKEADVPLTS